MTQDPSPTVSERLAGRAALLTGASGFLGKAVLATLLRTAPDLERIVLVLRADDDAAARRRLADQVLHSAAFDELDPDDLQAATEDGRLVAVAGDVQADGLGRPDGPPDAFAGVDVAIHCAASVSFEQPLDDALELNARGPVRLLRALRAAGSDPELVHVSTAYASGMRTGLVLERPSGAAPAEPDVSLEAELDAARAWRRDLEVTSRLPVHQHRFVAEAKRAVGPAGGPAVGSRAESERHRWVAAQLTERGRERARALGWADAYALSKALAERMLQAERPAALTIARPSIIESAVERPHPGWLEDLKVADPVILAYGAGMIDRFPANPGARLDLVPVDIVAHAIVAAAAHPPARGVRTLHLASGARNPVRVAQVGEITTAYFQERPLTGLDGLPVAVPDLKLGSARRVRAALDRGERLLGAGRAIAERIPLPRADQLELHLHKEQRRLDRLRRLAEMYAPYVETDCVFDDRGVAELLAQLHPADREALPFDVAAVDWEHHLRDVHLPALRRFVAAARGAALPRRAERRPALAAGPPAIAFFDVEGVVLDTTIAHFYHWLRTRDMPTPDRVLWSASVAARAPGWRRADRRSRAGFNRAFYRLYKDLPARELREQAQSALSDFILPRVQHEAVRRIRAHRGRGDRVVLITGSLDFLVAPLRHLADELVTSRLVEHGGRFTGELAEPPLTADGRASLAARLAAERGLDLADCHAYADSVADLPLLEVVGHAHPVNPDVRLAREARRRGWTTERWATEREARTGVTEPLGV
jgi:HAD superfamily hydrolase (TIGR01490 family)